MVLTAEQRRAQDDELAAKRQKKEEERQRVAQQFDQDRRDRAELHGSAGTGFKEQVSAVATPAAVPAATKRPESTSVRLQIRATKNWNKVSVFTCFSPDSTLSEVAHALWEDLVKGEAGSADGAGSQAVRDRMPEEAAIVFVETVPPRRRWASQDMQQTLRSAGLCPSSTLLAEVPPIEPAEAPAATAATGAEVEDGEGQSSSDEPPTAEEDATKGGKGGAGKGGISINWIKGGAVKGSAGKGGAAGRSPTSDDDDNDDDDDDGSDDPDDVDDPVMAGKGFSGKGGPAGRPGPRGKGKGPQMQQFPEGGGHVLGSSDTVVAAGGAALAQYSTVVAEQPVNSAEQQKAARDARLAALERRGVAAASVAAPKAAGQAPSLARTSAEPKGQMGDGQNRAARAEERQAILQRLQEDKEDQLIRRPLCPASTVTRAAQAETSGVRLQIRCPVSKRIHIAVGIGEASLLSEVLVSAAAGLDIEEPALALGYPPWTEFTGDDCKKTLKELGLCPSATLLIKSTAAVAVEAPGDEDTPAVTQAPPDGTCPKGHTMTELKQEGWCDMCNKELAAGSDALECQQM